jgi:hypothetical protein
MAILDANFSVEGSSAIQAHAVAYGATVDLAALSLSYQTITWEIVSSSKSGSAAPAITPGGTPVGATASFTQVSDPGDGLGRSWVIKCTQTDAQGNADVRYRVVGTANANGKLPICADEGAYRDATHGWSQEFNELLATASGGSGFTVSGSPSAGDVVKYNGSAAVWAGLDAFEITSFSTTTLVETSQTITPAFTSAQNRTPTSLVLTNNANGESKSVVATPTSFSTSISVQRTTPNQTYVYTLTGSDGIDADVATVTITWGQRNFAGVATAAASLATIVAAATYTTLDTNGSFTFSATSAGGSERVCFAFPTRYGTPTVEDDDTGLGVGITLIGTSSYTNAQGYSENYDRYSFDSAFIGTKTFNVAN